MVIPTVSCDVPCFAHDWPMFRWSIRRPLATASSGRAMALSRTQALRLAVQTVITAPADMFHRLRQLSPVDQQMFKLDQSVNTQHPIGLVYSSI